MYYANCADGLISSSNHRSSTSRVEDHGLIFWESKVPDGHIIAYPIMNDGVPMMKWHNVEVTKPLSIADDKQS